MKQGNPPIFITGPTASGKSAVALHLAGLMEGEIISVDSMQVYRGLDIGTAKPCHAERAQVTHHLIDVVDLTESFDAAQFVRLAEQAVRDILGRGRRPIFCGGTGLYFKAYLEGVGEAPSADPTLRAELEAIRLPELLAELQRCDPRLFATIDRQNKRRVVRAIEVARLTGRPFSEHRTEWSAPESGAPPRPVSNEPRCFFALRRAPEDLRRRIDRRVDAMFEHGLVAETEQLLARGLEENRTAMQAIGYRQVIEHLRGKRSLEQTIALVKQKTRQLARRQMTWFRHQVAPEWIQAGPDEGVDAIALRIHECLRDRGQARSVG